MEQFEAGWTPARVRRTHMFIAVLAVIAVIAVIAVFQPWFAWATPGAVPSCEPAGTSAGVTLRGPGVGVVDSIAASGCLTGAQTVADPITPIGTAAGMAASAGTLAQSIVTVQSPTPAQAFGLPRAVVVLVGCLALAGAGLAARRGWISLIGLLLVQVAHRDLGTTREVFLASGTANLTVALPPLEVFATALLLGTVMILTSAIFTLKVNHDLRAARRKAALAAGAEPPAELFDPVLDFVGRKVGRVRSAALEASERAHA